jgi:hypothetical protein
MKQDDDNTREEVELLKALLEKRRAGVFISDEEGRVGTHNMIATKRKRLADKNTK